MQKINVVSPSADPKYSAGHDLQADTPKSAAYVNSESALSRTKYSNRLLRGQYSTQAMYVKLKLNVGY